MSIRQPIVSVLGHVDHGKTSLLDYIRGTAVWKGEAGHITQHIGATEVPLDHIYEVCAKLIGGKKFDVPGLLFIDTPGHHAFTTLRARGGSLADIAVLVVDINEGIKPQTLESMNILRKYKTPFIIALNKIDLVQGWHSEKGRPFILNMKEQTEDATNAFEEKMYKVIARFAQEGYSADRYDRIEDFTRNIALVPVSARTGEGVPDLLLVLIGLAQRFLEQNLHTEEGPARGTVLEVKEEKGLGPTIDVIVYSGALRKGDILGLGTNGRPLVTKVKAILKPRPLDEIRDPRDKFDSVDEVTAAAGVKLLCQDLEGVVAGGPLRVIKGNKQAILDEIAEETKVRIEVVDAGVFIKADALGSLEALAFECAHSEIPIRKYEVGPISKRDVIEVSAYNDVLHRAILAFNVPLLPDAKDALPSHDAKIFLNDVVYGLIDDYKLWVTEVQRKAEADKRSLVAFPGKVRMLPNCVFRVSKPAIFGVRVLTGRIRTGQRMIDSSGNEVGKIRSIRSGEETKKEAIQGDEVAISIDGPTVGRQINVEDILYVDILESEVKSISEHALSPDEKLTLDELIEIKRKKDRFWSM
ncbi:MAG: translation initiation factor IF-2 [Methanomassiliicoccales archaeon]|nr:translation initiation factor IF-2 [Methanomassiliicoccales archaeon]